jgi:alkanesulfonate monooxygenase SsuD/methylene tetrahydromethanopterin reductase-like flavin-dependent oxidoreductase (luciferase family)
MKIGLVWGYWPAQPPKDFVEVTQEAEKVGFNSVWTAESWGSDAFTPLTWLAAHTSKIKLGTGVVQLSARTPVATAMAAMTAMTGMTAMPAMAAATKPTINIMKSFAV